ncbi:Detected protein of confused Function [Hibiscus syriacus]|uniref:Detected protein of confused Function n=1 Tax=Hibiscus syriacus TaxID=106335 RepID=A0A6A3AT65_HIBSY|nr:Detected protein of confused Function [Hibiscus syriacus]
MATETICATCGDPVEDMNNVFRTCSAALLSWKQVLRPNDLDEFLNEDIHAWIASNRHVESKLDRFHGFSFSVPIGILSLEPCRFPEFEWRRPFWRIVLKKPIPNPKFNKKGHFQHQLTQPDDVSGHIVDDHLVVTHSAASDDASSINRKINDFISGSYARSSSRKKPLPKKNTGNKRPLPPNFSKELKRLNPQGNGKPSKAYLMKNCSQILSKLMKHKHGYIFNSPVDVIGLGLHDYYAIIKNPMDLGTVKSRGMRFMRWLSSFLRNFWNCCPLSLKLEEQDDPQEIEYYEEELLASSWDHGEAERMKKDWEIDKDDSINIEARSDKVGGMLSHVSNSNPPPAQMQLQQEPLPRVASHLPQEKMDNVVHIIRRRNGYLRQDEDEIELDIEAMDTKTLWELDPFVTNYKKMVSKIKRQALLSNNIASNDSNQREETVEKMDVATEMKKSKKADAGDDDVDVGDEMPMSSFPSVEIEKDKDRRSSSSSGSSSSNSGSSLSSDSESGSDSDGDDARS